MSTNYAVSPQAAATLPFPGLTDDQKSQLIGGSFAGPVNITLPSGRIGTVFFWYTPIQPVSNSTAPQNVTGSNNLVVRCYYI